MYKKQVGSTTQGLLENGNVYVHILYSIYHPYSDCYHTISKIGGVRTNALEFIYPISSINTPGVLLFSHLKSKCFVPE